MTKKISGIDEEIFIRIFNKFQELVKPEIINWTYEKIRELYIASFKDKNSLER